MIEDCVRGFYDKSEADKYQFSEESTDYKHVLLVERGLIYQYENNNFEIPRNLDYMIFVISIPISFFIASLPSLAPTRVS
jgi:hypothetical protein